MDPNENYNPQIVTYYNPDDFNPFPNTHSYGGISIRNEVALRFATAMLHEERSYEQIFKAAFEAADNFLKVSQVAAIK